LKEIHLPHLESVIYDNNISKHYHFVDEKSGAILDIDDSQLELKSKLDSKFQVRDIEVIVRGRRRA
jgi:Fe2+ or Zn2+ uptake regulation protein